MLAGDVGAALRRGALLLALAAALAVTVTGCGSPAPARSPQPRPATYYLSLGDSLSQGVQPDSAGTSTQTPDGYANQLYAILRRQEPTLRLVKLGCPGETTTTMIRGGTCSYADGSQLTAAVLFLRAHRGRVGLVTLDIGANDPDSCITEPAISKLADCVWHFAPRAATNLDTILTRLRQADPNGRIIAMTYYLPELAEWRNGVAGRLLARLSELAGAGYNSLLAAIYTSFDVRIANVSSAFHTADFAPQTSVPGLGTLPRNAAEICELTWECAAPPRGPNQHANLAGYRLIAHAFLQADS